MPSLHGTRAVYRSKFYEQSWWVNEKFAYRDDPTLAEMPVSFEREVDTPADQCASAAQLADLYVRYPDSQLWRYWSWTCDFDDHGCRVYVFDKGKGFEVHRHLTTENFGRLIWK